MTRRRSSPLGLELVVSVVLALVVLPLLSHGAPVQDAHADLQRYSEGCYYNYNHYSEGDRILTNEPCLNCTCHNKMLMCYLRVCPFTKPIGHDCTVEKREDQCCPIITCPEVPVDVSHHNTQMIAHESGTELSIPEKYGCSIDNKFFPEGAQVPSNPNKPCELCYCIRNRTSCLMQECTLHIDGCQPIYNKGSCCPVRYNCDHENELLELEDFSTTTTTVRPTPGYVLPSTTSPVVTTDCIHNNEVYADGASLTGKNACEHCYCMRGDIVCAVQECEMPTLESGAKTCRALPPAEGECCPSNYVCDDATAPTEATLIEEMLTTLAPKVQGNLHESVSQEDVQLQEHIDDKIPTPAVPEKSAEPAEAEQGSGHGTIPEETVGTTVAPTEAAEPSIDEEGKKSEEEDESSSITTVSMIKETSYETTQSPIELTTTHKTEEGLDDSHIIIGQDKEYDSTQAPIEDEIIKEDKFAEDATTPAPAREEEAVPSKEDDIVSGQDESTTTSAESSEEAEIEKDTATPASPIVDATTIAPTEKIGQEAEETDKTQATEAPSKAGSTPATSAEEELASTTDSLAPSTEEEEESSSSESAEPATDGQDKIDHDIAEPTVDVTTVSPQYEMVTQGEDSHIVMPEIGDHKTEIADHEKKPKDEAEHSTASPIPETSFDSEVKKDELPQITVDSTTVPSAISEEEDIAVSQPTEGSIKHEAPKHEHEGTTVRPDQAATAQPESESVESEETSTEALDLESLPTSKPSSIKEDSKPVESTEGTVEDIQKPVDQGDETPAVVGEITATPSKPAIDSEAVPKDDEEATYQTTSLPAHDTGVKDVSQSEESQEGQTSSDEDEVQSTESSVSEGQKEVEGITTALPTAVSTPEKDASTVSPSKDSGIDSEGSGEEVKGHPEQDITDATTISPSVSDAKTPNAEEDEVKGQPGKETDDSTTISPSSADSKVPIAEEEKVGDQEGLGIDDSTTIIPSLTDSPPTTGEEEVKVKPGQEIPDSTTTGPSVSDTGAPITEEETVKPVGSSEISSEKSTPSPYLTGDDSTTLHPAIVGDEKPVSEEELEKLGQQQPEQHVIDSTTVAPTISDSEVPSSEEEEMKVLPEKDSTTIAPTVSESEVPSSEEEEVKVLPEKDSTTIAPTGSDSEVPSSEEEEVKVLPEKDSTTGAPSDSESKVPSSEEQGKIHGKPEQGIDDSTTLAPSLVDSKVPSGEEADKVDDSTTVSPSIGDSKAPSGDEEDKIHEQPEQGIDDSTTLAPSIADSKAPSADEEDKIHEQPEQGIDDATTLAPSLVDAKVPSGEEADKVDDSTTVAPSIADSKAPSADEEDKIHEQPEQGIDDSTTLAPSLVDSKVPSGEEAEKVDDSTTVSPSIADSKAPSADEEDKIPEQPEQGIDDSTTLTPSLVDAKIPSGEEADKVDDSTTVAPSVADSKLPSAEDEHKIHEQPEQGVDDSTTITPSVADSKAPSAEEEAKTPEQPEESVNDSTTIAPSVDSKLPSGEEADKVHEKPEEVVYDSTTVAPSVDSKLPSGEQADKTHEQPEEGLDDSTTITPALAGSQAPSAEEEDKIHEQPEQGVVDSTTVAPSVDSEVPSAEEEDKIHRQPEQAIDDSTTIAPSIPDSKAPSTEEADKQQTQPSLADSTTIASPAIDHEDKQKAEDEDIHRTTLPPISSSDEDASDVVEAEGSGEQMHEIIPSAIPGEGDCLVNDQTFANNATVPTSNECELSCSCISSIVVCQRVQCYEPPQPNNCVLDEANTNRCCPQYICGVDSFAEDQRTTTPEGVEDEEIHFTTLAPTKKSPEVSGELETEGSGSVESAPTTVASIERVEQVTSDEVSSDITTRKPEEEAIKPSSEDDLAKTERPAQLDEISTPSSIDIEMPIVTPEEPMSHVKDDSVTEPSSSYEGSSEEDISTERPQISDDKIQPLPSGTAKPVHDVTGDIDELVQVTAAPDAPLKKPSSAEESTTLKGADEKLEESATLAPLGQGVSAGDDSVTIDSHTESGKPIVAQEEISTESPIVGGAPKIDESIFATEGAFEAEPTTTRPKEFEIGSEAPSLSSVLDSEGLDSTQSEEAPETHEQSSNESGEETTESEEDTKLPSHHEKLPQITTIRPIASDQTTIKTVHTDLAGEIVPGESSTIIPESDYQKPEMPEDMSHTKVEDEKPVGAEKSEESEESTEKASEAVPPSRAPGSTVLTPVKPSEDDQHKDDIPPAISDKKDVYPPTESAISETEKPLEQASLGESKPLSPTITPAQGEEESLPGTVAPVSDIEPEVEKDEIASQTTAPDVTEQSLPGTVAPVTKDESEAHDDKTASQTDVPAIEKEPVTETSIPVSVDESESKKDEPASQTSAPVLEVTETPISEVEKDEPASQTSAPSIEQEPHPDTAKPEVESEVEQETISGTTSAPVIEKEPVTEGLTPTSEDQSEEEKEEIASQTSAPSLEKEPVSEEEKEEIAGPASGPVTEKQPIAGTDAPVKSEEEKKEIASQTTAPTFVEQPLPGTLAPSLEEESEEEKDELATHTAAPAQSLDEKIASQAPTTVSPSSEEADVSSSTTSSSEEEEAVDSDTAKPTAEDKYPGATDDQEPSIQISLGEHEKEVDITTISTPIKAIETEDEGSGATETPVVSIPVKAIDTGDEDLDTTEIATASTTIKSVEKEDQDLATTKSPADVELPAEEVASSTQGPAPAAEKDESLQGNEIPALSEESTSAVQTSEQEPTTPGSASVSDTTSAPVGADLAPSKADRGSEEDTEPELSTHKPSSPVSEDKPSAHTDKPESIENETSAETDKPISSTDASVVPVVVTVDEVTAQPSKPSSDDQISGDEVSPTTVRPSVDETPTESSLDKKVPEITEKEPSSEESLEETKKPASADVSESEEIQPQTEKPVSTIDVAVVADDSEKEHVEEPTSEQAVAQTEGPISVPKEEEDVSVQTTKPEGFDEVPTQTEQAVPASGDQQVSIDTTAKPEAASEEADEKEVISTVAPVDLAHTSAPSSSEASIAPVESEVTTASSEQSEGESEQTEAPKDDHKIQTIAEFVTERSDERTTVLPIQDTKPEQPAATSSEETSTSSSEEDEEIQPEVAITTEKVIAVPTVEESEHKTPAPETPSEVSEEDQKSEEIPTESAIPTTTSEKPIVPAKDKFDTDLPKPIATEEESSEEEEDSSPTTAHPLFPHIQLDRTTLRPELNASEKIGDEVHESESTGRPAYAPSSTLAPTTQQPTTSAPSSHYQPPSYGHVPPQYPSYTEDEYTDEDETEVFGPGTCRYGGKLFVSAQQIPRDDPCDFCFCFRSDIICLQQSCPPPISGCHEEPISGFCCPRYECPVSMATVLNITTSTTTTSTTLPPHFLHHAYRGAAEKNGCHISGKSYKVGDKIDSASGPCMNCTCGGDGQMKCDPKTCSPEPMLRQMIAVVASRRR